VAHFVNGVPIISVPSFGVEFGRLDLKFDTARRAVTALRIHAPQRVCSRVDPRTGACAVAPGGAVAEYEGRPVTPSSAVAAAIEPELTRVRALRAEPLGVVADTAISRGAGLDTPLGNLFAAALLEAVPDADVALGYGSGRGGLRADLPQGGLTFGDAYDAFPFDNRITRVRLTGAQLERVVNAQLPQWLEGRRGLPGIAGLRIALDCEEPERGPTLRHESGRTLDPGEPLIVALASSTVGRFAAAALPGEPAVEATELPILVRDAVAAWLLGRGRLAADSFDGRWRLAPAGAACLAAGG
jgi:2',3'-cyclic-nucleotide 2'-phosphodiesterase (5'-nucleotidase family)